MFRSLYTLIAARRYPDRAAAQERVDKAHPKYLTQEQHRLLLEFIGEVYP